MNHGALYNPAGLPIDVFGGWPYNPNTSAVKYERSGMEPESDYEQVRIILEQDFLEAVKRRDLASFRFQDVNNHIPSGLPHPDGTQRIYNASREYSASLQHLSRALKRLTDFREFRIVPEDLKPHG